jgi:hypothetical protein
MADFLWYLDQPMVEALSRVGSLLAVGGFVLCMKSRERDKMLVAAFVPVYIGLVAVVGLRWARWILPTLPFLCALASYVIVRGVETAGRRYGMRVAHFAGATLVLGVALPLLKADIDKGTDLRLPDTRTLAGEWVTAHIPARSKLLVEANTPYLPRDLYDLFLVTRAGALVPAPEDTADSIGGPYRRNHVEHLVYRPFGHLGLLADLTATGRHAIEYMIMGGAYDRYVVRGKTDPTCAAIVARYDSLMATGIQIAEFDRAAGKRRGPRVRVYRLAGLGFAPAERRGAGEAFPARGAPAPSLAGLR